MTTEDRARELLESTTDGSVAEQEANHGWILTSRALRAIQAGIVAGLVEAKGIAEGLVGPDYDANDKMRNIGYRRAAAAIQARIDEASK